MLFNLKESSMINSAWYDDGKLFVKFNNGDIYYYQGVTLEALDGWETAASVGKYFHKHIRNKFPYVKAEFKDEDKDVEVDLEQIG